MCILLMTFLFFVLFCFVFFSFFCSGNQRSQLLFFCKRRKSFCNSISITPYISTSECAASTPSVPQQPAEIGTHYSFIYVSRINNFLPISPSISRNKFRQGLCWQDGSMTWSNGEKDEGGFQNRPYCTHWFCLNFFVLCVGPSSSSVSRHNSFGAKEEIFEERKDDEEGVIQIKFERTNFNLQLKKQKEKSKKKVWLLRCRANQNLFQLQA